MVTTPDAPDLSDLPEDEKFVVDLLGSIDPDDLGSLKFSFSRYQQFDDELPTAVVAYIAGQIGVVVWNLSPGQENDFHVHPATEHLHVFLEGTCEYQLGEQPPFEVGRGDAVMVPAGIPHGVRNTGKGRASYAAITSPGPYEKVRVDRP
jgi:quercetin dioxygenase-like cupin family protein